MMFGRAWKRLAQECLMRIQADRATIEDQKDTIDRLNTTIDRLHAQNRRQGAYIRDNNARIDHFASELCRLRVAMNELGSFEDATEAKSIGDDDDFVAV